MAIGDTISRMPETLYLHANDKESMQESFNASCQVHNIVAPPGASEHARGAAYEVEFTGFWSVDGKFYATHVNDVELEKPTVI